MPVVLSSLRVEASLDPSQYVAGARAKADADAQMVSGANALGASLDVTERRLGQSATAIERLARSIDPAYQAQQKLEAGARTLQRALDGGSISTERHTELLDLLQRRYSGAVGSLSTYSQALERTAQLQQQINSATNVRDDFGSAARATDIKAYGEQLDQLRAKYSPLFAVEQAYAQQSAEISSALKVGAINVTEYAEALSRTRDVYERQVTSITAATAALSLYSRATEQATDLQKQINATTGVKTDFGSGARSQDIQAYGQELDRLRAKYSPLFAAEQSYAQQSAEINTAFKTGAISVIEYAEALSRSRDVFESQVTAIRASTSSLSLYSQALTQTSEIQKQINTAVGVKDDFGSAERAKDIEAYGQELDRVRAKFSPLAAAQQAYQKQVGEINDALKAGAIDETEHTNALARTTAAYTINVASITRVEEKNRALAASIEATKGGFGSLGNVVRALSYTDLEILRAGVINTAQSLASGETASRTFTTQLFQTAPALQSVARGLGLTGAALFPVAGAFVAAAAAIGLFIAATVRFTNTQQNIKEFNLELEAFGKTGTTTGVALQEAFERLRDSGVGATDSLAALHKVSSDSLINPARAEEIGNLAKDLAAATRSEFPQAFDKLSAALEGGVDSTIKYGFEVHALTADQAAQIRQTGDLSIALDALHKNFDGYRDKSITPYRMAIDALTKAWDQLLDTVSKSGVVSGILTQIKGVVDGVKTSIDEVDRIINILTPIIEKLGDALEKVGKFVVGAATTATQKAGEGELALQQQAGATPPPANIASPTMGALSYASQAELGVLAQIRARENAGGDPYLLHNPAPGQSSTVSTLADVQAATVLKNSHAFGLYGLQPGTFQQFSGGATDISAESQNAAALALLRARGPNSQGSWAASAPAGGYPTAGLEFGGATAMAALPGRGSRAVAGLDAQQAQDEINKIVKANDEGIASLMETGAAAKAAAAWYQTFYDSIKAGLSVQDSETAAQLKSHQAFVEAAIDLDKDNAATKRQTEGTTAAANAFITSTAEGLRANAVVQASIDIFGRFGEETGRNAEVQERATLALRLQAAEAIRSSEEQARAFDRTTAANQNAASASAQGTVALKEAQVVNQAALQTQDVLAKAEASRDEGLKAIAEHLQKQAEAQIRANQAAQESTQVNLLTERTKEQTELVQLQATQQGKTTEEIQNQVLLLRTKQQLETQFSGASDQAKQNLVAQTEALAASNIKLGEARAAEGRLNDEIRSIADTVINSIGSALDEVLSGKKITDWGQLFRDTLRSVASTIIQSEFIKPLLGSIIQGFGFSAAAQQYGTLGGAGTLLGLGGLLAAGTAGGGGSSAVSAGAANSAATNFAGTGLSAADVAAVAADPKVAAAAFQAASASGAQVPPPATSSLFNLSNVGAVASLGSSLGGGGGLFGASGFLGGIGSAINNFGGSLGFAVPGAPFSATIAGPSVPGALTSAQGAASGSLFGTTSLTGALGGIGLGATAGGLLASVTGGNSLLGSIGGGAGGLAGTILGPALFGIGGPIGGIIGGLVGGLAGLFGNNKPSNNASGAFVNTATGGISGAVSGGVAANDQAVQQISSAIGDFSKSVQSLTGGTSGFGTVNVQAGTRDGIKVGFQGITQAYGDAQSAINDVEKKIIGSLSNLTDTVKTVLAHVSDPSQLQEAVAAAAAYDKVATAFDGLFASIEKSKTTIGPYETILNQLNTQYDTLKASAEKYGLALGPVNDSYNTARQRLVDDFNKNINDALGALSSTFQQTLQNEITQAQQRVTDAKAIGADLTQVEKLNQATLERTALQAASQLGGIVAKVGDFIGTLGQSFESLFTTVESQIARLATNANGIAQLSGTDPYSTAYNALQTQQAAAIQAAQASYSNPELQNTVINAIRGVTLAGLARLATDFQANITELTLAAQNPVQEAVNKEVAAGQQRVAVAQAVGADLAQVEQFNADNLKRVATAANQSVAGIVTAQDAIKTAGTVLSASISSVVQSTKGPFAQALDSLNIAFGKLIGQIDSLSNASADVTPVLQAYAAQIDALRGTFNKQVADLTLAITDPVQAALNAELEAGQRRVADAQAIGADIAAVDEFNRLSLLKVFQSTQSAVQGASDSLNDFTNSLDSLQSALSQLTGGTLSGLTPAQAVTAAVQNFQSELALVKAGNTSEIPNLAAAGTNAVQTAQQVYGNAPQTAKIRDQITRSLQDIAISTATQASQEAAAVTTTTQNQAANKAVVQSEATQAHKIADALQAQADLEQKRTGMVNADLQAKAETARKIANELDRQATSNADIADTTEAFSATLSTQYSQQAAKLRTIANELQGQADLERARTGLQDNVYQRESDGARLVATLLDQQAAAMHATTDQLYMEANAASAIAGELQKQADEEYVRTGVKNNLLQQEASLATQIATALSAQATHEGNSTQAGADKEKLSVSQVQQLADIGQRTVEAQAKGANAATGTAATMASGLDLAIQELEIQRQIAADTNNVAQQSIAAQVNIANQVLAAQKAAADAFTAAVTAYSAAVARASAAAAVPPPPPAQPAPPSVVVPAPAQAPEDNSGNNALLSFLVGAGHAGFHARGTGSTAPGWVMVGEEGPEWLYQKGGSTILPNGIQPPSNDDDVVAELRRVREELAAMRKQIQGGQGVASLDAKQIANETASVGRKISIGQPMRRNFA